MADEPTTSHVSLRDYVDARLQAISESTAHEAKNLERRLDELSKLREDVVEDRAQFVQLDNYNASEKERAEWRESIATRITVIETRSVTWTAALGIFFTALQITVGLLMYWLSHASK